MRAWIAYALLCVLLGGVAGRCTRAALADPCANTFDPDMCRETAPDAVCGTDLDCQRWEESIAIERARKVRAI